MGALNLLRRFRNRYLRRVMHLEMHLDNHHSEDYDAMRGHAVRPHSIKETHSWEWLHTVFLHDAEATTRVPRATVHPTRLARRVKVLPGIEAEGRLFPGTCTIYSLVPDRPHPGDFNNLQGCARLSPSRETN
jgi:hypothetical protein